MNRNDVAVQIAYFARLGSEINAITDAHSPDDKRRLIELRRRYAATLQALVETVDAVLSQDPGHSGLLGEFRRRIHDARTAVAAHQAKWPAILIDDDKEGYAESARSVADQLGGLQLWLKSHLLPRI